MRLGSNSIRKQRRVHLRACLGSLAALIACLVTAQPAPADDLIPEDTCIIEVDAPPGTRVSLNGKDYGEKRTFTYDKLVRGKLYSARCEVTSSNGSTTTRQLYFKGGWRVRTPVTYGTFPEVVLQGTEAPDSDTIVLSPDGRHFLSGRGVWDVETGVRLRTFETPAGVYNVFESSDFGLSPDGTLAFVVTLTRAALGPPDFTVYVWTIATGATLHSFKGRAAAFGPDNRYIAVGRFRGGDRNITIHDLTGADRVRTIRQPDESAMWRVHQLQFSPNGTRLLGWSDDAVGVIWDVRTGAKLASCSLDSLDAGTVGNKIEATAFSPNGRYVVAVDDRGSASLWNSQTMKAVSISIGDPEGDRYVIMAGFTPDSRRLATLSDDGEYREWDIETEAFVTQQSFAFPDDEFLWCAATNDGRRFVFHTDNDEDGTESLWIAHAETGELRRTGQFGRELSAVSSTCISDDRRELLLGTGNGVVRSWDMLTGIESRVLVSTLGKGSEVEISPDSHQISCSTPGGSWSSEAALTSWDRYTGDELTSWTRSIEPSKRQERYWRRQFWGPSGDPSTGQAASGPTGQYVYSYTADDSVVQWDVSAGKMVREFKSPSFATGSSSKQNFEIVTDFAPSPTGRQLAISTDYETTIWETATGRLLHVFDIGANCVAFRSDGAEILTCGPKSALWDSLTGTRITTFDTKEQAGLGAISSDGSVVAIGSCLRNARTGTKLREFSESNPSISADGRIVITTTGVGVKFWDIATGDELCTLIFLNDYQDWLVVTPEGLFDGSEGGMQKVMFRIGDGLNVVPVSRFFQDFYREGLLARIWAGERPMPDVDISASIPPTVALVRPERGGETGRSSVTLTATVKDNGGGVKGPFLRHNGARVNIDPQIERIDDNTARYTFAVNLLEGDNRLRIEAFSGDGAWEAEPAQVAFTYSKSLPKPDLYVVAVGINDYAADALSLSYAVPDVEAITRVFADRGEAFYDHVHVTSLLDDQATKAGIRDALRDVAGKAREQDTLLVYLSGHGFTVGQRYYFVPAEFEFASQRFEDDVEDQGLPGDQVFRALGETKARKRILVLDTCNSGAALAKSGTKRRDPFAFAGAIRRLSRSEGVFTIAASSASDQTAEIEQLGHGVLTYSLLQGIQAVTSEDDTTADGNNDGVVNISEWFGYSADLVPRLTKQYLGVEQDVHQQSEGVVFPVLPLPRE